MALTYTWKVKGLRKQDQVNSEGATLSGAVVQTYWECEGTDENGNTSVFSGATPFSAENVPAGTFVAFEDLTEETVLGWIRNVVEGDGGYMDHIEERIRHEIGKVTIEDAPMPWAPEEVTPVPNDNLGTEVEAEATSGGNTDIIDSE
jgi:hypothetical protein